MEESPKATVGRICHVDICKHKQKDREGRRKAERLLEDQFRSEINIFRLSCGLNLYPAIRSLQFRKTLQTVSKSSVGGLISSSLLYGPCDCPRSTFAVLEQRRINLIDLIISHDEHSSKNLFPFCCCCDEKKSRNGRASQDGGAGYVRNLICVGNN
jgi:hypothetical protein